MSTLRDDTRTNENDFAQFLRTFFEEAGELVSDIETRLAGLSHAGFDRESVDAIFRGVHSIKAGAGAFGFKQLVTFAHNYEALLDLLRDGSMHVDEHVHDVLTRASDILSALVEAARDGSRLPADYGGDVAAEIVVLLTQTGAEAPAPQKAHAAAAVVASTTEITYDISFRPHTELFRHANEPLLLVRELNQLGKLTATCDAGKLPDLDAIDPEDSYLAWTFTLTTASDPQAIADVFEFVTEDCDLEITPRVTEGTASAPHTMAPASGQPPVTAALEPPKAAAGQSLVANNEASQEPSPGKAITSIRVDLARVDRLVNMVGELVISQAMLLQESQDQLRSVGTRRLYGQEELAARTRELQECVMAIRMQPLKSVFARMPRIVREVSTKLKKKVQLVTKGENTEVDKTVIEELADPLTHMLRNAIDHGIEDPETRLARGKPEEGTIELSAAHRGGRIVITISDDGGGIDRERLKRKAIEKGIISPDAVLTDSEIENLVFAPGFSTAEKITDVSGRGVGMDVVRRNIKNLGGRVNVSSVYGSGTRFTLILPLTLAVLDGMLIGVAGERYILPLTCIIETLRPERNSIKTLVDGNEVVTIRGEHIPLLYVHRLFNVAGAKPDPWNALIVLVELENGSKLGLVVDELLGQQQAVIKALQGMVDPIPGVSSATILGNGRVALILDVEQFAALSEKRAETAADREWMRANGASSTGAWIDQIVQSAAAPAAAAAAS